MKKVVKILILIALIALAVVACVKDVKVSEQAKTAYEQVLNSDAAGTSEAAAALENYESVKNERFINFCAMAVCYVIVWRLVVFAGKRKKNHARLSQEEAEKIAQEITSELEMSGMVVDAALDEMEDSSEISSLDEPEITELEYRRKGIVITWNTIENADGYFVLKKRDEGPWIRLKRMQNTDVRAVDYRIESNHTYRYSVMAFHNTGDNMILSTFDREQKELFIENGNMLPFPELHVDESDGKKVIKWDKVEGAALYAIFRKKDGEGWKRVNRINSKNPLEFTDNEAEAGTEYTYSVTSNCFVSGFNVRGVFNTEGIKIQY